MAADMTPAQKLIKQAREEADRIASTKEGRKAAKLSDGNSDLEAVTRALFGRDV